LAWSASQTALRKGEVIGALALARVDQSSEIFEAIRADLREKADNAIPLVDKYIEEDGVGNGVYKKLRALRNERLAHR
jgi:hypothetical protein